MNEPNQKPTGKEITIGPDGKKVYPQGTIFTRVKFTKSERTGQPIGFISQNPVNKMYNGVREDSKFPKSVCWKNRSRLGQCAGADWDTFDAAKLMIFSETVAF